MSEGSNIYDHLVASADVKMEAARACSETALEVAGVIAESLRSGGKVMLCGNGGSASDAQHIAAEFVGTLEHERPRTGLRALALTTDTSFLTAYSNDFGYEEVFARQVETLGDKGDVLVGLSTSGNSKNICGAMKAASKGGMIGVAMTGEGGGALGDLADYVIAVPSSITAHIQESHIALGHGITAAVEKLLGYK